VGEGVFGLLVGLTTAVGTATVLFIGMRHVQAGVLTLGQLLLVLGYLSQLYAPLKTISKKVGDLEASLASAERAFALLDAAPDVAERPNARPLTRARGAVAFRNVWFAFGTDQPVLHDISFEIGAGTRLGIVGATGAGKTTLVSLLTRFYDPTAGQILLDGVDLRDHKVADLRNQFAIVLQEPVLFSTSIAENIAYGRPDAGDDEIVAAAKAANAHDFIMNLPQGYETLVGERGMRLSGGERQRISLARAFLKNVPILILDEPTSSVDTKTEAAIMEAMERLMQGRTTVMIAHRLSTLAHCDARLEIEHGRLVPTSSPTSGGTGEAEEQAHGTHDGGEAALQTPRLPVPGPLATFPPAVAEAVLAYRRAHPRRGARRAQVDLQQDLALRGLPLPDSRTIHRAWVAAGLVTPRRLHTGAAVPPDARPAVWQVDHQDGPYVGHQRRRARAPATGLIIGADVAEQRGAHATSEVAILGSSVGDRDHRSVTGRPNTGDRLDRPDVSPGHACPGRIE
jgi:ABC-type multidrug transport system ATPase subunit